MEKDKDKKKIEASMSEIKKAIQKDNIASLKSTKVDKKSSGEYLLLEKIISSPSDSHLNQKIVKNKKKVVIKTVNKIIEPSKNSLKENKTKKIKTKNLKKLPSKVKSPVADVVDREIKPIIKKWIDKNLRAFVKSIVIEEMKGISKATEKPSGR